MPGPTPQNLMRSKGPMSRPFGGHRRWLSVAKRPAPFAARDPARCEAVTLNRAGGCAAQLLRWLV